ADAWITAVPSLSLHDALPISRFLTALVETKSLPVFRSTTDSSAFSTDSDATMGSLGAKIKRYSIKCSHLSTNQKIAFDYTDPHDRQESNYGAGTGRRARYAHGRRGQGPAEFPGHFTGHARCAAAVAAGRRSHDQRQS